MTTTTAADPLAAAIGLSKDAVVCYRTKVSSGEVRHRLPRAGGGADGWRELTDPVRRYLEAVAELGIDPLDGVADAHARALDLRDQAKADPDDPANRRQTVAADLASGKLTTDKATAALDKVETAKADDAQRAADRKTLLRDAAHRAYRTALGLLHDQGDDLLDPLRDVALDALDRPDSRDAAERWQLVHDLAGVLRRFGIVPSAVGAKQVEYMLGDPAAWWRWRCQHADRLEVIGEDRRPDGSRHVALRPSGSPPLTLPLLAAHADAWQPGLLTAADVARLPEREHVVNW